MNPQAAIERVIGQIPNGLFLMTAAHEEARTGVLTTWVQQCSTDPPMIVVALAKGSPVEPFIRDTRSFALCLVNADDRLVQKRFGTPPSRGEDPFVAIPVTIATTGAPILDRASVYFDCDLAGHLALDCDHRLYIGLVRAAGTPPAPNGTVDGMSNGRRSEA